MQKLDAPSAGKLGLARRRCLVFHAAWGVVVTALSALLATGSANAEDTSVRLVASRSATLSAEVAGRVQSLGFREGEVFERGDLLVSIDCTLHQARLARVEAIRNRGLSQLETLEMLNQSGATSGLELANAQFDLQAANAELHLSEALVERCAIAAPFDGAVTVARIQAYEYVNEGQPLIDIIDQSTIEARTFVPSHLLAWLQEGDVFQIRLSEIDHPLTARVERIAPAIDPVSKSVMVYGRIEVDDETQPLRPGMSGVASFIVPVRTP